jgi:hypothetical protein
MFAPPGRARPSRAASSSSLPLSSLLWSVCRVGAPRVGRQGWWALQERLEDSPALLNCVLRGEERTIADQRVVEETLVGSGWLAELGGEGEVQVHAPRRLGLRPLGPQDEPHPGIGVDPLIEEAAGWRGGFLTGYGPAPGRVLMGTDDGRWNASALRAAGASSVASRAGEREELGEGAGRPAAP